MRNAAEARLFYANLEGYRGLTEDGVSQAEIARELGVSRQAVQKMLAV